MNGQLAQQTAVTFAQNYGTEPLFFGSSGESYWDGKLSGRLDEVSLYNTALTSNQIAAIYAAGSAGKCKAGQPPSVTVSPGTLNVAVNGNATFTANASGTPPLSYQWQFGGAPITGATAPALSIANAQTTNTGSYTVVVTNAVGAVTSLVSTLNVLLPPAIASQPASATNIVGGTVNFTASATGSSPLSYQWQMNGANVANNGRITGATTSSLTISGILSSDAGNYLLVVTNLVGTTDSAPAALTVNGPPVITAQPSSQGVLAGANVSFNVGATGTQPLNYRWSLNGSPLSDGGNISGSATATLSLTNVQTNNAGNYSVTVTNVAGSTNSTSALLAGSVPGSCDPAPSGIVSWWPGDGNALDIASTNNGALQGGATDTAVGEVGEAFSFNGTTGYVSIPDAPALRPTNLTVEAWVLFNSLNSTGNAPAGQQYIVFKQNSRTSNFEGYFLGKERTTGGDFFVFGVSSSSGQGVDANSPAMIATNVWYHIAGVRGPNYIQLYVNGQLVSQVAVTFAQDYGTEPLIFGSSGESYWDGKLSGLLDEVSLYNTALTSNQIAAIYAAGSAGKCKAPQPPSVTVSPSNESVALNGTAIFTANASGTLPLSYQWQFGGVPISGANTSVLDVPGVQTTNAGNYTVVVANSAGSVTSLVSTLSVVMPPVITLQPLSSSNLVGSTVTFTSGASGSSPLSYQWQLNGGNLANNSRISGATSNALTITGVVPTDAGSYMLVVTNAAGATDSVPATLTINGPPIISAEPANESVLVDSNASFSVGVTGTQPLSYQWQFNGVNLADGGQIGGSGTATLTIVDVQSNNVGNYSVLVTNAIGMTNSTMATLAISQQGNCDSAPSGIVSWWPGDGNANDIVGSKNGTLQGGATASAPGEVGPAFSFNGTTSDVSIPDAPSLDPTNLTVEAWVMFTNLNSVENSSPGQQYIVFKQNSRASSFEGYYLGKERNPSGDFFAFAVSSSAGQTAEVDSPAMIFPNVWYHVAGVRGPNYVQLYVNGALIGQATATFAQNYGTLPLFFGTSGESYWDAKLSGYLDEVSLYNRALAASEITAIYAAGNTGKCKAPAAPTIAGQPASQVITVGGTESFSVVAAGSQPLGYQWFKDGVKLANIVNISGATASTLTLQDVQLSQIGNYQVVVANSLGNATSVVASLNTGIPPANDDFVNAQAISGSSGMVTGNNADGTKEPGEPNHAGNAGGASVWYAWTAPSTSPVTFDTALSAFDTLLAVYTGSAVNALTVIASNDDLSTNCVRSRLTFTPVTGKVYYVAVDGKNGATGNIAMRWDQASVPLPDLSLVASAVDPQIDTETFAPSSCAVQEGLVQAGTRTVIRFDTETENSGTADLFFGNPATNSLFVWAPCHAHYHFQNYMSYRLLNSNGALAAIGLKVGFCILDVFRWSSSAGSTSLYSCTDQGIQVGWGDLYDRTLDGQWIDITGLPNGNYTMQLECNPQGIIQEANYANNVIEVPIQIGNPNAAPLNDNFANAQALLGGFANVPGSTVNATKEAGEPNHAGNPGGHSIWFTWTAPSTKAVTIDTINSSFATLLAVYTGTSLTSLTVVASNINLAPGDLQSRVTFNATAGTTYQIAVDGYNGASGSVVLTLNQTLQNDNFVNAESIGGVSGVVYGSTTGATKEPGEPNHAGKAGGNSIWYFWTAPISGVATFNTYGSQFDTLLAAYTGTAVSNLTLVASDTQDPPSNVLSTITFNCVGLTRYDIAIDGYNGANGDSTLNWSLAAGSGPLLAGAVPIDPASFRPQLSSTILSEGELQLNVKGLPLQNYRIEVSCDLQHWLPTVTTLADQNGFASYTDKTTMITTGQSDVRDPLCGAGQASGLSGVHNRFYRAIPTSPNN